MGSGEPLFQSTWRRQEICKFFLEGRCLEDARWVEGSQRSGRVLWGPAWKQPQFKGHVAPCWWLGVRGSRDLGPFGEAVFVRLLFGCKMPTKTRSRWWFQIFFIFTPTWGRFPFWLIFFRWVETTNQRSTPVYTALYRWFRLWKWWSMLICAWRGRGANLHLSHTPFGVSVFLVACEDRTIACESDSTEIDGHNMSQPWVLLLEQANKLESIRDSMRMVKPFKRTSRFSALLLYKASQRRIQSAPRTNERSETNQIWPGQACVGPEGGLAVHQVASVEGGDPC